MIRMKTSIVVSLAAAMLVTSLASARVVSISEAETVAKNWIATVINYKGQWGDSKTAGVAEITELKRGDRVIGYYCRVAPSGHIVISLVEGLAPVKAFSETSTFDPTSDEGPADLIKFQLERRLDAIEKQLGPVANVKSDALRELLLLDHTKAWQDLLAGPVTVEKKEKLRKQPANNYVEGQFLLSSRWNQFWPYNLLCPVPPAGNSCTDPHCATGCTATAGAQIMRYWSWPPGQPWLNMPDDFKINPTAAEITAVSGLCYAVGLGVQVNYCYKGDCASNASIQNMADYFDNTYYNPLSPIVARYQYAWNEWYDMIVVNMNQNRPIHYSIKKHAIICDGYWYLTAPMYHMNYGWGGSYDDWYALDDLYQPDPEGTPADEWMLHEIYPLGSMGPLVVGAMPANPSFPYRYVDRDCSAQSADFAAGQLIQFLPYMRLTCTSGYLRINGAPGHHTRLYTGENSRGVVVRDGQILMHQRGAVRFDLQRPD